MKENQDISNPENTGTMVKTTKSRFLKTKCADKCPQGDVEGRKAIQAWRKEHMTHGRLLISTPGTPQLEKVPKIVSMKTLIMYS